MSRVTVTLGDCVQVLKARTGPLFDAVCCDPPYHLTSIVERFGKPGSAPAQHGTDGAFARAARGFMGKEWDGGDVAFRSGTWRAIFDQMKPGAHLAAFSGTRTYHRMAVAIEDAGFEVRDQLAWIYGSGMPKSAGLKPAYEPICFAQKPHTAQQLFGILAPIVGELIWQVASSVQTATHLSESVSASGLLNTVTWLSRALAALLGQESRFTTETAYVLTTELRTLRSSLSEIMRGITTPESTELSGIVSNVWVAAVTSRSALANCERLRSTTADEIAIDWRVSGDSDPEASDLTPNWEPICLARKPCEGTRKANIAAHGTGGLNIDACRTPADGETISNHGHGAESGIGLVYGTFAGIAPHQSEGQKLGRWPANILHDGSDEIIGAMPAQAGGSGKASGPTLRDGNTSVARGRYNGLPADQEPAFYGDTGSAARFFYSAKAGPLDRLGSEHPTVKPVDLMRWLCRLITPAGGLILDPFAGSGTTGIAAIAEGFDAELIDLEADHVADIETKLAHLRGEGARIIERHLKRKAERAKPTGGTLFD